LREEFQQPDLNFVDNGLEFTCQHIVELDSKILQRYTNYGTRITVTAEGSRFTVRIQ
jgi:hypothetical protein